MAGQHELGNHTLQAICQQLDYECLAAAAAAMCGGSTADLELRLGRERQEVLVDLVLDLPQTQVSGLATGHERAWWDLHERTNQRTHTHSHTERVDRACMLEHRYRRRTTSEAVIECEGGVPLQTANGISKLAICTHEQRPQQ